MEESISRKVSERLLDHLTEAAGDDVMVTRRDVGRDGLPYVDGDFVAALRSASPNTLTDEQQKSLALSDELVSELKETDILVIGTPMHNFNVPTVLKAWIDRVVRAGRTFTYTSTGPIGLLDKAKKVYIVVSSAGMYTKGAPAESMDHLTPYMKMILKFVGLEDVTFIQAGGVARRSPDDVLKDAYAAVDGLWAAPDSTSGSTSESVSASA